MRTKLRAIEHRAVSGNWLLGEDFIDIIISEETYSWLWRNIYNICDNPRLVKMFWANSSQYFDYRLEQIDPDYSTLEGQIIINNKEQIDKRNEERKRFLEFHYALGGLLLYRKQYETISYIFKYSQSHPPKYVLLPETTTEIFQWLDYFSNEFNHRTLLELKYNFPELDNLGNSRQVDFWICSYISVLYLRQYSMDKYYTFQNFTAQPDLPKDVLKLSNWLDSASYFEKCLNNILSNHELIKILEFEEIIATKGKEITSFTAVLKDALKEKIGQQKLNAELSEVKIQNFYSQSNEIISKAFNIYKPIFIPKDSEHSKSELILNINGERTIMSKSAFTDNDVQHLNYDTVFAKAIANNKIFRLIPNAFLVAKNQRYLLNKENILLALTNIIGTNNDIVIIGVNLGFETKKNLDASKFKDIIIHIPSTEFQLQDTLFVLRKKDLPAIEYKDLKEEEIKELQLIRINEEINLYVSVIDINKDENLSIKDKWNLENEPENQDLKVQLTIAFFISIYWKNERNIIQINIASDYREQGIQNDINDVMSILSTGD